MLDANSSVYEAHFVRTPFQLLSGSGWKRLVAFRVDAEGVFLGGAPARYQVQTASVPWEDVTSIVLWQQRTAGPTINHIGLLRHPGSPQLPGPNRNMTEQAAARVAPHIEYELLLASRPVNFWRVDPQRLQTAVDTFAPHVPVLVYSDLD